MKSNDVGKVLIKLIELIRPPLPQKADHTVEQKARMYDQARAVLYDDSGRLRPLNPRLSRKASIAVIAILSGLAWGVVVLVVTAAGRVL